ncbi:MAG: hypothetical protein ABW162_15780 [Candidatus Sedimenticola sp. PURPLELP]
MIKQRRLHVIAGSSQYIVERLVDREGCAVDACVVNADANRRRQQDDLGVGRIERSECPLRIAASSNESSVSDSDSKLLDV